MHVAFELWHIKDIRFQLSQITSINNPEKSEYMKGFLLCNSGEHTAQADTMYKPQVNLLHCHNIFKTSLTQ